MIECNIKTCFDEEFKSGYCKVHFHNIVKYGDPLRSAPSPRKCKCVMDDCQKMQYSRSLCQYHYHLIRGKGYAQNIGKCTADSCKSNGSKLVSINGQEPIALCCMHEKRHRIYGDINFVPFESHKCTKGPCKFKGCSLKSYRSHLCKSHFINYFRFGDPTIYNLEQALAAQDKKGNA